MAEAVSLKELAFKLLEQREASTRSVPRLSPAVGQAGTPAEPAAEATSSLKLPTIPPRTILLAPRYNGGSEPLASPPECWCCYAPYRLKNVWEYGGKTYAWLEPGCGCLDGPQAIACCGLCARHCQCRSRTSTPQTGIPET